MEMENKFFLIVFIKLVILIININGYISSYLPSAINQFNNFIYSNRMKTFTIQNYTKKCSMNKGPNCYFTENIINSKGEKDIDILNNDNDQDLNQILDYKKEWESLYSKSKELGYFNIYNEINTYLYTYKKYISPQNDSEQIPPQINLYLSLTFESYDDITINGDIYAYPSKPINFFTEIIYIEIYGKLRLQYGKDLNIKNQMRYPTKTFGIIESSNLNIKLGGKLFICEYFFFRTRDENIYKMNIEGYLGNQKVFTISKEINYMNKKVWIKTPLPNKEIDRLLLPGGIDVDNFKFVIPTIKQYDITVQFHHNYNQRIKNLVEDNDIY